MVNESTTVAMQQVVATAKNMSGKQKLLFGTGVVAVLAVMGPVAVLALATVKTLATAGLIAGGIFVGLVAAPMLTRKWKNFVLKTMISEAQNNPIMTLRNQSIDRHHALDRARTVANGMVGKLNSLADSLEVFRQKHGKESGSRKIYDRFLPLVQKVQSRIKTAEEALRKFDLEVDVKSDEWAIMLKAGDLKKALKDAGVNDPLEMILTDAAFKAVSDAVNTELAELDALLSSEDMQEVRALSAPANGDIIDLIANEVMPEPETVQAASPKKRKVT